MGRTGKLYAYENYGVAPDILASAKGIGGGFPLGAVLATAEAAKGMGVGSHGTTYGGNPLAMACGNAVLDIILAPGFLDDVARKGLLLRQCLAGLAAGHPDVDRGNSRRRPDAGRSSCASPTPISPRRRARKNSSSFRRGRMSCASCRR